MTNCFVACFTNERNLALFPAGAIVRYPHHCELSTRREHVQHVKHAQSGSALVQALLIEVVQ